jgi:hypothetical protein
VNVYAKVINNEIVQYPYTLESLQADNPYTNYDSDVNILEIFPHTDTAIHSNAKLVEVTIQPKPETSFVQKAIQLFPVIVNGVWTVQWNITTKTPDELASDTEMMKQEMIKERNSRLSECDWTQLADATVDKSAWSAYRQALRDITKQDGFPWNITWPNKP